ncbi:MAG: HNH endonuclease [Lachnospiraceae bacterium]|nr:HNH endonuclease [Lachnospiraceae bacterium]
MRIPVAVDCSPHGIFRYHFRLRRFGLDRDEGKKYRGTIPERKLELLKEYCWKNHLKFYIDNEYGTRSRDYRARFFNSHRPVFGRFYFCAYCGKLLSKKRVTVDHLYPVAKVSKDPELQKKLKRQGIEELNSEKNLVAACDRCNQKKGAHMGDWIRKGKIGRHAWVWVLRWMLRIAVFVAIACALWYVYKHGFFVG